MRTILACVFIPTLLGQQAQPITEGRPSAATVHDVKNLYLGPLGDGQDAEVIRSKVLARLIKSGRVNVVEILDQADSLMLGSSKVSQSARFSGDEYGVSGGTASSATAGVRIVNRSGKIIWVDDATSGLLSGHGGLFSKDSSSSLADRIVKDLLKAIAQR